MLLLGSMLVLLNAPEIPVAIFEEPSFAAEWVQTPPATIARLLAARGIAAQPLDAAAVADPSILNATRVGTLIAPYGAHYPVEAWPALREFLRGGGKLLALGGYAFREPVERTDAGWVEHNARVAAERTPELLARANLLPALDALPIPTSDSFSSELLPAEGAEPARLHLTTVPPGTGVALPLTLEAGKSYALYFRGRGIDVGAPGFGFVAIYEYGADGKIVQWFDAIQLRGRTEWQECLRSFRAHPDATRREVHLGTYLGSGSYELSELVVAPWPEKTVMTTAEGKPMDGLICEPEQLGMFDADFPLRRAQTVAAATPWGVAPVAAATPWGVAPVATATPWGVAPDPTRGQALWTPEGTAPPRPAGAATTQSLGEDPNGRPAGEPGVGVQDAAAVTGWAASGITGATSARWIPLLDTRDRYGRSTGPAMAMLVHYGGYYAGSIWAYCGLEGDMAALLGEDRLGELLASTVGALARGVFVEAPRVEPDVPLPGQALTLTVRVRNASDEERPVEVSCQGLGEQTGRALTVPAKGMAEATFEAAAVAEPGLHPVTVSLRAAGEEIDRAETGYVVSPLGGAGQGPRLTWEGNGFRMDGRPRVLFGSDTGANAFWSPAEGPRAWAEDLSLCRDFGLDVYENLHFAWRPEGFNEVELRWIDGITRVAGERGRVYMSGWLIGADTWITPESQAQQAAFLARVGERYRETPWLLHYINGDLASNLQADDGMAERFHAWALAKHGSEEALAEAWAPTPPTEPFPAQWSGAWGSRFLRDAAEFGVGETGRWVGRHAGALREAGATQPITCEYYQLPLNGVDLPETVESLDSANIGFFGHVPGRDLLDLTRALSFEDSRIRGKGLALGEFGVKTHPAWSSALDPASYHTQRGLAEQRRLFVGLTHIGLGMGVSKFQNWCLRDFDEYCFPWGVFQPNAKTPKPIAYTYRSLTLLGHHVTPKCEAPRVVVLLPDFHRLGGGGEKAYAATLTTFDALNRAHVPFQVLPDTHTEDLPASTEVLWWPVPFCASDAAREGVTGFVEHGGRLYLSGDLSWDEERQRTRQAEFEALIGARITAPGPDPDGLALLAPQAGPLGPCTPVHGLEPAGAEVLASLDDGTPVLLRNTLGAGRVVYANTAAELLATADGLGPLYERALTALAVPRLPLDDPRLYAYEGPTHEGGRFLVVANMSAEEVHASLTLGERTVDFTLAPYAPLLVAWDAERQWSALSVTGSLRLPEGASLKAPGGACALRVPGAPYGAVVGPYTAGEVVLRDPAMGAAAWELGEPSGGAWRAYEAVAGSFTGEARLDLDADRATLLSIVAEEDALEAARSLAME